MAPTKVLVFVQLPEDEVVLCFLHAKSKSKKRAGANFFILIWFGPPK